VNRGQLALGSTDGAASEAAGVDGAATDGALVGVPELDGELQASTAPPSDALRARASRIRLNMLWGSSDVRRQRGDGALVTGGNHAAGDDSHHGRTIARRSGPECLQAPVSRERKARPNAPVTHTPGEMGRDER
jgi:hypothetical protein